MMPSTEIEYKNRIKELEEDKKVIAGTILREITYIINTTEGLSEDMKTLLLNKIWRK